jgi:catechol 2,3-dioxygenase-like lactoylglutathione lyase family enzyme
MPVRGFDHLAITVEDVERTVAFYTDLLGAETLFLDEFRHADFVAVSLIVGGNVINVHPSPHRTSPRLSAAVPTPGSLHLCFRWDGPIDEVIDLLTQRGLPIVEGPVPRLSSDGKDAVSVYSRDPDDNLIEFLTTG